MHWRFADEDGQPVVYIVDGDEPKPLVGDFASALDALTVRRLIVRINSYRGGHAEGLALYQLLRQWSGKGREVETQIGFANGGASLVALAGDRRYVAPDGAWGVCITTPRDVADGRDIYQLSATQDELGQRVRAVYVERLGGDAEWWWDAQCHSQWFEADRMVTLGIATIHESHDSASRPVQDKHSRRRVPQIGPTGLPDPAQVDALIREAREASKRVKKPPSRVSKPVGQTLDIKHVVAEALS